MCIELMPIQLYALAHPQIIKVKVKFTLEQATKAQRGSRGIALLL
jgi:hypothetical protein